MMTPITFEQISEVYAVLANALRVAQDATEKAVSAKSVLETARAAALRSGSVVGKNEAEREADLRGKLACNYTNVDVAERELREARLQVELARLAVDALRMQLRVAELAAREEE